MQSIFRLPWCSDHLSPKMADKSSLERRPSTVVEIPVFTKFKRKRTASPEPSSSPAKRQRADDGVGATRLPPSSAGCIAPAKLGASQQTTLSSPPSTSNSSVSTPSASALAGELDDSHHPATQKQSRDQSHMPLTPPLSTNIPLDESSNDMAESSLSTTASPVATRLQEVIENQFNMQILFKHNELRLIEQELAKCQVALEQLRRCELRPFPGSSHPSEVVTSGLGPALAPPPGYTRPLYPAPYGVTDGPYSRHYQRWLPHDPKFDPTSEQALSGVESVSAAGRPIRNSGSARKPMPKTVAHGARPLDLLQSIPSYPAFPPRDKSAPLVLKRSTDGQLVKLMCNDCHRGNFSSIQGFLNHCRIAHKVDLKSHDEAAVKCGHILDESEMASLPPTTVNTPISKPAPSRSATVVSTPNRNMVHPLNGASAVSIPVSTAHPQPHHTLRTPVSSLNSAASSASSTPFTPAGHLPRLSAHFAKHQLGGDLAKAAAMARQKVDLGLEDELASPDTPDLASPLDGLPASRFMPASNRAGSTNGSDALARPSSRKGFRQPASNRPRPPPLASTHARGGKQIASGLLESPQDATPNLSPHAVDSNPGLVSDHDDDDQGSASEEESPHASAIRPPLPVTRSCADNMEIVVEECHDIDRNGVLIRRNSLNSDDVRALQSTTARPSSRKFGGGK